MMAATSPDRHPGDGISTASPKARARDSHPPARHRTGFHASFRELRRPSGRPISARRISREAELNRFANGGIVVNEKALWGKAWPQSHLDVLNPSAHSNQNRLPDAPGESQRDGGSSAKDPSCGQLPAPPATALTSFLGQDRLCPKVCGTYAAGMETYLRAPVFDLVIVDYRLVDGGAQNFMAELTRRRHVVPVMVTGAPLRSEAALYRSGAIAVLGAGFSPRSAAFQCLRIASRLHQPDKRCLKPAGGCPQACGQGFRLWRRDRSLSRQQAVKIQIQPRQGLLDSAKQASSPLPAGVAGVAGENAGLRIAFSCRMASRLPR